MTFDTTRPADAVVAALEQGISNKLRFGPPEAAVPFFKDACRVAGLHGNDPLMRAYRLIAVYRLAHLTLQLVSRETAPARQRQGLREAVKLLREVLAGPTDVFGPLPYIQLLAPLRRLRDLETDHAQRHAMDADIEVALGRAVSMVQAYARPARSRMGDAELAFPGRQGLVAQPVAQGPVVNLLELAVYFLGTNYDAIKGLRDDEGDPCEGLVTGQSFVLVGHQAHLNQRGLRLPPPMVREILETAATEGTYDLVFKLPARRDRTPTVMYAAQGAHIGPGYNALLLIALAAQHPIRPPAEMLRRLLQFGQDGGTSDGPRGSSNGYLRGVLSEARDELMKVVAPGTMVREQTLVGTPSRGISLDPGIRVLAAVDARILGVRYRLERG